MIYIWGFYLTTIRVWVYPNISLIYVHSRQQIQVPLADRDLVRKFSLCVTRLRGKQVYGVYGVMMLRINIAMCRGWLTARGTWESYVDKPWGIT